MKLDYANELMHDLPLGCRYFDSQETVEFMLAISCAIEEAEKFTLPFDGNTMDGPVTDSQCKLFRLPYPITFWQYEVDIHPPKSTMHSHNPNARALPDNIHVIGHAALIVQDEYDDDRFQIWSFVKVDIPDRKSRWATVQMGAEAYGIRTEAETDTSLTILNIPGQELLDEARVSQDLQARTVPEINRITQACAILNCENTMMEKQQPSLLRIQRAHKKHQPKPYAYYEIAIDKKKRTPSAANTPSGRTVRLHMRRGHIRHLKNANIWIKPMTVGDPNKPRIKRGYKIPRKS